MKVLNIESQVLESANEARLLELALMLAKEAGYDVVRDNWGMSAYDEYSIDEAIERFKPAIVVTVSQNDDDLPF